MPNRGFDGHNQKLLQKDMEAIAGLHAEGYSVKEIAESYHVGPATVSCYLHDMGVAIRRQFFGKHNPNWNPDTERRYKHKNGYIYVYAYGRSKNNYIAEHVLVWEQYHNMELPKDWSIHHLNGIKDDNRPENLEAMPIHKHVREYGALLCAKNKRIQELEARLALLEGDHD